MTRQRARSRLKQLGLIVWGFFTSVLLLLWLGGYAAAYVHPQQLWWLQFLGIGLPLLTGAVLLSTLLSLSLRFWKWFAVHGIILLLAAGRFLPFGALMSPSEEPDDLTLLSFNMRYSWGKWSREEKGYHMMNLMHTEAPDVIALQETWLGFRDDPPLIPNVSIRPLFDSLSYQSVKGEPGPWQHTTQPVLAKTMPLKQTNLFVEAEPKPESPALRAELMWKGRKIILYNLHLQSFGDKKPWQTDSSAAYFSIDFWRPFWSQYRRAFLRRAEEARVLRSLIAAETDPVIISGDFNETRHNWTYNHLAEGFTDAFQTAGFGWGLTYHSEHPFTRIDHILVDAHWDVTAAYVIKSLISDHRPVVARLRLRE